MKSFFILIICLLLISCAVNRELQYAQQQTQISYEKLISVLNNPDTSEREITMRYLDYLDKIRNEAKIQDKINDWNDAIAAYIISQQGSLNNRQIRNQMLHQMQNLNRQIERLR